MTRFLVYCTSASVIPELLNELNAETLRAMGDPVPGDLSQKFAGARKDMVEADLLSNMPPEIFDKYTDEQLQKLFENDFNGKDWLQQDAFAVLDEHSLTDHAVVIWYHDWDMEPDLSTWKFVNPHWIAWRVRFSDALFMTSQIAVGGMTIHDTLKPHAARFTGEDGILRLQEAVHTVNEEVIAQGRGDT